MLITPQQVVATRALDRIGAILREQGLTLEELIESGREERDVSGVESPDAFYRKLMDRPDTREILARLSEK